MQLKVSTRVVLIHIACGTLMGLASNQGEVGVIYLPYPHNLQYVERYYLPRTVSNDQHLVTMGR